MIQARNERSQAGKILALPALFRAAFQRKSSVSLSLKDDEMLIMDNLTEIE
jgi:hypothetical protein